MTNRIELTAAQTKRILAFRSQIEPLRLQISLIEQSVHATLVTIMEERGVPDGITATLTDDARALELPGIEVEE